MDVDRRWDMTTATHRVAAWADHPLGKMARIAIAFGGIATATLVLMTASLVANGSWFLVILGVSLAALATRAARMPTTSRLALTGAVLTAILLTYQAI